MTLSQHDIPLSEAIRRIQRSKGRIAGFIAFGAAIGALIAFTSRPIFVSEILMLPQSQSSENGASVAKRLSGLASAAGISLGGNHDSDTRDAAIATLSSYQTLSAFLGAEGIKSEVLKESARRDPFIWLGFEQHRTMWEAVRAFKDRLVITQEKDSSLVHVAVEWYDPVSASTWTNHLVALADARLRSQALDTARGRITFLQKELENNPIVSIREVISGMMENELRTMATAGADKEFIFRIIDPAIEAERPTRPHRVLIISAFAFCGLLLGSIIAVVFDHTRATADTDV